jgi:hypothetical protein
MRPVFVVASSSRLIFHDPKCVGFDGEIGEVPPSRYDGQIIRPGGFLISACGRSDPPSGTEGSFDLQEVRTGRIIAHISWEGELGGTNKLEASASDDGWQTQAQRPPSTGALGHLGVHIGRRF